MARSVIYILLLAAALPRASASEQKQKRDIVDLLSRSNLARVQRLISADPDLIKARRPDGSTLLHLAASRKGLELARLLLTNGAEVNAKTTKGSTPLHWAAMGDQPDMVKLLIANGADVNAKGADGGTPLCNAVVWNSTKTVSILILAGADPEAGEQDKKRPLALAAFYGDKHLDMIRLLIKSGADPNGGTIKPLCIAISRGWKRVLKFLLDHGADPRISESDWDGTTPLHLAAEHGDLDLAKLFLARGADVNAKTTSGSTPLHWAAMGHHPDIVKLLIASGADVNAKETDGTSPLYNAAGWGITETVSALIRAGADLEAPGRDGKRPLAASSSDRRLDRMRLLIRNGADPNGGTVKPLWAATQGGWKRAAELLLDHKANPELRDSNGCTLLHLAASQGYGVPGGPAAFLSNADGYHSYYRDNPRGDYEGIAKLLIARGVDVNARDEKGHTPLLYAVTQRQGWIADLLLKAGAKPDLSEHDLLYFAAASGAKDLARMLIAHGANVNAEFFDGSTEAGFSSSPLYAAVDAGARDIVELLLSKGARYQAFGFGTLLQHSCANGNVEIAALLLSKGADVNEKGDDGEAPLHTVAGSSRRTHGGLFGIGPRERTAGRSFPMMLRMARFLISKGANVNARDNSDVTPLFHVTEPEMARLLLAHGADVRAKNHNADTPLHYAARAGREQCAALLLGHGADANARDNDGRTPLHMARSAAVAKLLIEHGADVRAKADDGKTPRDFALADGRKGVAQLLRSAIDR